MGYSRAVLRSARPLLLPLAIHTVFAVALWSTGSMHGSWTFECGVGATAWDLAHGRNPHFAWSDYYDSWTSGYLLWALLEAPLMRLPWAPIFAVKAVSLATTWALGLLAWLFLREVTGRREALLGASALILCPPTLWYFALAGGNYHYTELVPSIALFWRLAHWIKSERWGARGAIELGLLAGLALATSVGALLPVALAVGAFVVLRGARLATPSTWLAAPAGALGAGPLLYKVLLHRPFDVPTVEGEFAMPYFGSLGGDVWNKLLTLPAGLADHMGFADVAPALHFADWLQAGLLLAVAGLALADALRSLRPSAERELRLLRALPGLYVTGILGAFLLLPLHLPPQGVLSDFRDVRYLPPTIGAASLALPLLLVRLPRPRRALGFAFVPMGLAVVGWGLMVPWTDVGPTLPYAGRCPIVLGMYAGKTLPVVQDGAPLRPELCAGFGDAEAAAWCEVGRATAVAVYAQARGQLRRGPASPGIPTTEAVCDALPLRTRRACFRQLGWALASINPFASPAELLPRLRRMCASLGSEQSRAWCEEGLGYKFADHLAGWPERLDIVLEGAGPEGRRATLAGVGARFAWAYRDAEAVERACARYDPLVDGGLEACMEGARSVAPW